MQFCVRNTKWIVETIQKHILLKIKSLIPMVYTSMHYNSKMALSESISILNIILLIQSSEIRIAARFQQHHFYYIPTIHPIVISNEFIWLLTNRTCREDLRLIFEFDAYSFFDSLLRMWKFNTNSCFNECN